MLAITLASLGALVYGAGDFLGGVASRRIPAMTATALAGLSGLVLLLLFVPVLGATWEPRDLMWGAISGVFGVVGVVLLYACLAIGPMSILSPLTALVSAISPVAWGVMVRGERPSALAWIGVAIALIAIAFVGFTKNDGAPLTTRGVLFAIGSGLGIGGFLITMNNVSADTGLAPLVANRLANLSLVWLAVGFAAMFLGQRVFGSVSLQGRVRSGIRFALACGFVDVTANMLLLAALRAGDLSIVSVLTALYPIGTIVLARFVLHERILPTQWFGLALALVACALFALG